MQGFARRADFWSGLALAALGAYIVTQARGWIYMGEEGPGPGFFPMWYGSAMIVLSLLLVAGAVLKRAPAGRGVDRMELVRAFTCWGAFVVCMVLMKLVGFMVAYAALTWFIVAVMARKPQRIALPVAIGGSLVFYVLFELALDVGLPKGMLF